MNRDATTKLILTIFGSVLVAAGIGLLIYYMQIMRPEREARELVVEGTMSFERGDKESINNSINIFSKVIARYPETKAAAEAYYYVGQGYEKLGLNRLAYLKYVYILKNNKGIPESLNGEIRARLGRLKVLKQQTEEGIDQLLGLANYSSNNDFRSRVYAELGHAYLKDGNYGKAKKMFDIALNESGSNEDAILGKASAYKHLRQDNNAYDLYEYFLKYYGNFSPYSEDVKKSFSRELYNSGLSSYKRGAYIPAIAYFKRFIRVFPGYRNVENSLYWAGESLFALHKYDSAIDYFSRVLDNNITVKDEDARMKKGYSYFMVKKFDLAAREFQVYLDLYPNGKFVEIARKWKEMSTKEILYRIQKDKIPEEVESEGQDEEAVQPGVESSSLDDTMEESDNYGVSGSYDSEVDLEFEKDNIAEL